MEQEKAKTGIAVGAHSADFIWRAGGAIALHARQGWQITVVCLTFGEKGESQKLWKDPAMTLNRVKTLRKSEAERAGAILGVHDLQFFNLGDYPMRTGVADIERLADIYRTIRPQWLFIHSLEDPYNFDHPEATRFAQEARLVAQAHGRRGVAAAIGASQSSHLNPTNPSSAIGKPR